MKRNLLFAFLFLSLFLHSNSRAGEEGKVSFYVGFDIPVIKYITDTYSATGAIGEDFISAGFLLGGEYWLSSTLSTGIEIIPEIDFKHTSFEELPIVIFGKTSSGMGYGKIGFALNYIREARDMDLGINVGGGAIFPLEKISLDLGAELTTYFRLAEVYINLALRIAVNFHL